MFKSKNFQIFKKGLLTGLGTAIGLTLGFALVSSLLVISVNTAGGLPIVGTFFASIIQSTQNALGQKR